MPYFANTSMCSFFQSYLNTFSRSCFLLLTMTDINFYSIHSFIFEFKFSSIFLWGHWCDFRRCPECKPSSFMNLNLFDWDYSQARLSTFFFAPETWLWFSRVWCWGRALQKNDFLRFQKFAVPDFRILPFTGARYLENLHRPSIIGWTASTLWSLGHFWKNLQRWRGQTVLWLDPLDR